LSWADGTSTVAQQRAGRIAYSHADDSMRFDTAATERMRIDSSGKVGIGTASPDQLLHLKQTTGDTMIQLYSNTGFVSRLQVTGSDTFAINTGYTERMRIDSSGNVGIGNSNPQDNLQVGADSTAHIAIANGGSTDVTSGINWRFGSAGTPYSKILSAASGAGATYLSFYTSSSERMRIDSSGRLLVGLTSSIGGNALLQVQGSGNRKAHFHQPDSGSSILQFTNTTTDAGTSDGFEIALNGSAEGQIWNYEGTAIKFGTTNTERMRIDSSGRLLVGTSTSTDANSTLQVSSTSFGVAQIFRTGAFGASLHIGSTGTGTLASPSALTNGEAAGYVTFRGYDSAAWRSGANIAAHADGQTWASGDCPTRLVFSTTADGASSPTERMRIDKNGNITNCVGIYNNTTAAAANVFVGSAGDLGRSTSSAKYKTDIESIEDSYSDALLNCRPVWYRSICEGDNPAHGWWGFIAEEVAAIDPRLVHWKTVEITYDENGSAVRTPCDPEPEGVAYDRFVPHLLNLIKRQQAAIETLEQRLTDAGL